jgi:hypothetical protein
MAHTLTHRLFLSRNLTVPSFTCRGPKSVGLASSRLAQHKKLSWQHISLCVLYTRRVLYRLQVVCFSMYIQTPGRRIREEAKAQLEPNRRQKPSKRSSASTAGDESRYYSGRSFPSSDIFTHARPARRKKRQTTRTESVHRPFHSCHCV